MTNKMPILATTAMLTLACGSAHALTITTSAGLFSPEAGVTTYDFDSGLPSAYTGGASDGAVVSGSLAGKYAVPFGDATPYLTVAYPSSSGSHDMFLSGYYDYFGLYWGSIDTYNSISFYKDGSLLDMITGSDALLPANGDQGPGGSTYINIHDIGGYNQVTFASTQFAFESDNHAVGVRVPEPATLGLLGFGLAMVGVATRRRQRALSIETAG